MPPTATTHHRDALGPYALLTVGAITQRLRWCPPGAFTMGSPDDEPGRSLDEGPQHRVRLTEGFWLGDTPVTQALWMATGRPNPSRFPDPRRPVERVDWSSAQEFCAALGCALPTEAQWEYACRAGTTTALYTGPIVLRGLADAPALEPIAWYAGNSGRGFERADGHDTRRWPERQYPDPMAGTRVVATRQANPWGLYDLLGNVFEWCRDPKRVYTEAAVVDPADITEDRRALRGGSWGADAACVRAAHRASNGLTHATAYVGFRLLRAAGGPGAPPGY